MRFHEPVIPPEIVRFKVYIFPMVFLPIIIFSFLFATFINPDGLF